MIQDWHLAYRAKEKVEFLLSDLEKLKDQVSLIEGEHDILKANYSSLCQDAMSRITAVKSDLESYLESRVGDLEVFKPGMNNLQARAKLGLVSPDANPTHVTALDGDTLPKPGGLQRVIDKVAGGIESGLSMMGDSVVFVADGVAKARTAIGQHLSFRAKKT